VQTAEQVEVLAEAAAGLSHQLQAHLLRLAETLSPSVKALNQRFLARLAELGYDQAQAESLASISPGAAAEALTSGAPLSSFLEIVQYRGRRLAKLGLTPSQVVGALEHYDVLLDQVAPGNDMAANLTWVRGQLHFLVVLSLNTAFHKVREAESQAFYELFRAEVESHRLDEMLPRFLAALMPYTGADEARLYLLDQPDPEETPGAEPLWQLHAALPDAAPVTPLKPGLKLTRILLQPQSFALDSADGKLALEASWKNRFKTCWSVPLCSQGRLRGVMQFAFVKSYVWLPREVELLSAAAERCCLAADKAKLLDDLARREEQIRRLAEHMVEVEESERRRISRELHDEAGQSLLCIRLQMEMLEQELPGHLEPWRQKLAETREMTEHTIVEIRRLIAALSPAILEQMGLAAALRQLIGRFRRLHSAEVKLSLPRRLELPKKVEIIVYRLVQEMFNNIAKYSLASHVNLSLDSADGRLKLHVGDDGVGFDVDEAFSRRDCFGLSGLRERVALLGGTLVVRSRAKANSEPSAGSLGERRKGSKKMTGQVGVDRHGTAIWVELPLGGHQLNAAKSSPARTRR